MESSIAAEGRQRWTVELSCECDLSRAMPSGTITADALAHSARMCPGRRERAYCSTVEHSRLVAERFEEAGWRAAHVDGDTPAGHRLAAVGALARGELDVLANCYLFTEGVDLRALGAVILLRPTQFVALYLQRVGRALRGRAGQGKELILDHAGNVWRHELGDEPRQWSLRTKRRRSAGAALVKKIPDCHSMVEIGTGTCPEYGFVFAAGLQRRNPVVIVGVLDQRTTADRLRRMSYGRAVRWAGADPDRLSWVANSQRLQARLDLAPVARTSQD
jgi:DNA repair protein RadD